MKPPLERKLFCRFPKYSVTMRGIMRWNDNYHTQLFILFWWNLGWVFVGDILAAHGLRGFKKGVGIANQIWRICDCTSDNIRGSLKKYGNNVGVGHKTFLNRGYKHSVVEVHFISSQKVSFFNISLNSLPSYSFHRKIV